MVVTRHRLTLSHACCCYAHAFAVRTQALSCALLGELVTTRTLVYNKEQKFSIATENSLLRQRTGLSPHARALGRTHGLVARATARAMHLSCTLSCAQCVYRVHRPSPAVATRNFLSRPTTRDLCRDKEP